MLVVFPPGNELLGTPLGVVGPAGVDVIVNDTVDDVTACVEVTVEVGIFGVATVEVKSGLAAATTGVVFNTTGASFKLITGVVFNITGASFKPIASSNSLKRSVRCFYEKVL